MWRKCATSAFTVQPLTGMARPMFPVKRDPKVAVEWGHSYQGYSTFMLDLERGLLEFLAAPASPPRSIAYEPCSAWDNEGVILSVTGGLDVVDEALYDAVSLKYEVKVRTFREAFRVCARTCTRAGHRDWADLDLEVLQDCHPGFASLGLPAWVDEMMCSEMCADELERCARFGADEEVPF